MNGTAILDTFLTVIANDVANRLAHDDKFCSAVAQAILYHQGVHTDLHAGMAGSSFIDTVSEHIRSDILEDREFSSALEASITNVVDGILGAADFSVDADSVSGLDRAIEDWFDKEEERMAQDHVVDVEQAIDAYMNKTDIITECLHGVHSDTATDAILNVISDGMVVARRAAPRAVPIAEEPLDFDPAFPNSTAM
jgi:hypothetical protein